MRDVKKLNKLGLLLEGWYYPELNKRPKHLTLCMIETMVCLYERLCQHDSAKFFMSDLAPYFEKCGFTVEKPHGDEINYTVRF